MGARAEPLTTFGYRTSGSAGGSVALLRAFPLGKVPANLNASLDAGVRADSARASTS